MGGGLSTRPGSRTEPGTWCESPWRYLKDWGVVRGHGGLSCLLQKLIRGNRVADRPGGWVGIILDINTGVGVAARK